MGSEAQCKEEQGMELEALESLFPVEIRIISESEFSLVGLVPYSDNSQHNFVSVDLKFSFPASYPVGALIDCSIAKTTGCIATDSSRLEDLAATIGSVSEENAGCCAVYQIAERVQEWLRDHNEEEKSLHDTMQQKPSRPVKVRPVRSDDEDDEDYDSEDDSDYSYDSDEDDSDESSEDEEYEGLQSKTLCPEEERVQVAEFLAWKLEYDQVLLKNGLIKRIAPGDTRQTGKQEFLQSLTDRKEKREDGKVIEGGADFDENIFGEEEDVEFDDDEEDAEMDGLKQGVSHELMKEAKDAFALFDKQSGGTIKTRDMGLILRSLGFALSGSDIKKMEKDADKDGMGLVKLPDFLRQLDAALALTRASKEETKKAIKLMDDGLARLVENKRSGSGSISSHYFRQALTRMGERMSQDEFVEMCRELEVVDGRITVDALTKYVVI